jgi:hypothetical protein
MGQQGIIGEIKSDTLCCNGNKEPLLKSAEIGQQGIIGEIKSDTLRYNGNKEPLWIVIA